MSQNIWVITKEMGSVWKVEGQKSHNGNGRMADICRG